MYVHTYDNSKEFKRKLLFDHIAISNLFLLSINNSYIYILGYLSLFIELYTNNNINNTKNIIFISSIIFTLRKIYFIDKLNFLLSFIIILFGLILFIINRINNGFTFLTRSLWHCIMAYYAFIVCKYY